MTSNNDKVQSDFLKEKNDKDCYSRSILLLCYGETKAGRPHEINLK